MIMERRNVPRYNIDISGKYSIPHLFNTEEIFDCKVEDVSDDGCGIQTEVKDSTVFSTKPKGNLKSGSNIKLLVEDMVIPCQVVYVEVSKVGLRFVNIQPEQLKRLLLMQKGGE